ncbi:MAG: helix-turn-helix domain containing protein [Clostridium sp.]|jgi:transposase-like protein|uniref:helix-turn-helix domain-containing protein n=1 Tax=Clostridium sp. TaxID=1506 RepID=UPI0025B9F756|nr:helix-turn-helix domain-containing protein [Clostridium sp.]MCH3962677.1 helix-turn-helix domain containing protein [Clostridium sp.]MCI2201062.1 helix-turn-helix domain containing protein [Clostridium sp.]
MLTKDQEKMITMLIEGEKITDIARKIGVSRQTIYSWRSNDEVNAELDQRRRDIANQGNNYILKDVRTYIDNIKDLANNSTDKRVKLAANQCLLSQIYGNATAVVQTLNNDTENNNVNENELEEQLKKFKNMRVVK